MSKSKFVAALLNKILAKLGQVEFQDFNTNNGMIELKYAMDNYSVEFDWQGGKPLKVCRCPDPSSNPNGYEEDSNSATVEKLLNS